MPNDEFRPYCIQRLMKPSGRLDQLLSMSSGFSHKVEKALAEVFTLDYMGSAEFEFGAVPKSMQRIAEVSRANYRYGTRKIQVSRPYWEPYKWPEAAHPWKEQPEALELSVHFLAPKVNFDAWAEFFKLLGKNEKGVRLKETTHFDDAAYFQQWKTENPDANVDELITRPLGWLDIREDCFAFIDATMNEQIKAAFDIKKERREHVST